MIFAASIPWWQDPGFLVPTVISIGAVIFGIWGVYRQIGKKEISYEIVSDTPIISVEKSIANRVKIELDGKTVSEVSSVVIRVWNSGNKEIMKADYDVDDPLQFHFEGRVVISSEDVEPEPEHIIKPQERKTFISQPERDTVEFTPLLLNPKKGKERVTFSVLLSGIKGEITYTGRIAGGDIKKAALNNRLLFNAANRIIFILAAVGVGIFVNVIADVFMNVIADGNNIDLPGLTSVVMVVFSIVIALLIYILGVKNIKNSSRF